MFPSLSARRPLLNHPQLNGWSHDAPSSGGADSIHRTAAPSSSDPDPGCGIRRAGSRGDAFDVLVVGGGINGAGIARDLSGRGLSVLLCEKDDLAQHTSSSSTKMIHGGIRYLEYYEFSLVRKALAEREVLLKSAPHVISPL